MAKVIKKKKKKKSKFSNSFACYKNRANEEYHILVYKVDGKKGYQCDLIGPTDDFAIGVGGGFSSQAAAMKKGKKYLFYRLEVKRTA